MVADRSRRNPNNTKSAGGEPKQSGGLFWRGEPSPGVPRCEAQIPQFSVKNECLRNMSSDTASNRFAARMLAVFLSLRTFVRLSPEENGIGHPFSPVCQLVEKVRRKFGFTKRKPSLRGRVARRQPRREGFSPTFAVCVRRRFEPLSLLRRQLPSQGSQTAGNIALSHTRPCRENRKQRHCTDSCRPCVLAEITFSTS